jgi:TrmH family RNA methyltransferase
VPPISSRQNALVKRVRRAMREHAGEIVLEGPKQLDDAIAAGWKPIAVLRRGEDVTDDVFDSIADTRSTQGVVGLFERPGSTAAAILSRTATVAVALDAVQDPGNVGTIVRLAAAFDAAGVLLLPGCADPYGPKAIRASAGAVLSVPTAPVTPEELTSSGLMLCAAAAGEASADIPSRNAVLIFGNEGSGVSPLLLDAAARIAIPMSHRVESLNVASAAAILLAESYRRRA